MAVCTSIVKVDKVSDNYGDLLLVTIDSMTQAYWIYDYTEALKFIDKEVIVDYRKDIYKGELTTFIATFTVPTVVSTLDKHDGIKLYLDQVDNLSNISFREIEDGDNRLGCIVFCTQSTFKSSSKATWMELTIRDRTMRTATLRLFNYENKDVDYTGRYIKTALKRNQYGFQSELIKPLDDEVYVNPEIALAKEFIMNYFADDSVALNYIGNTEVLEFLEELVDYERGYGLMRLAMELALVESLENISKDVDLQAIGQALLLKRGYLTNSASVLSHSYTNITLGFKYMFPNRRVVMQLLDESLEEYPAEYVIMNQVINMVDVILRTRKGCKFMEE